MKAQKIFLVPILVLFCSIIVAQNPISCSDVIAVDSTMSSKELYFKALNFITLNFKSANDVIQLKDEDSGKIICKGVTRFINNKPEWVDGVIRFTMQISVKKGKYKYEFSNFVHEAYDEAYSFGLLYDADECSVPAIDNMGGLIRPVGWKNVKSRAFENMKVEIKDMVYRLVSNLNEEMKKRPSDDNW